MLLNFFSYLKFLLKSTNEHGVHSPFVFEYLTKCLYKKPKKNKDKSLDLLLKSIAYFKFKNVLIIDNPTYKKEINKHFPKLNNSAAKVDLVFYESIQEKDLPSFLSDYNIHNDSQIIINNIHKNQKIAACWSNFINQKNVTVSIDFYYCGALFIRKEQLKEHFSIRI